MKYVGSKRRIAKYILPIILEGRKYKQWYIEPFCGGCNSLSLVSGLRLGNDINYYLIECFRALQKGWLPPKSIIEQEYKHIKNNKGDYDPALVGYAGFQLSFGAMWFSSFRKDSKSVRDYSLEGFRSIVKQVPTLKNIHFTNVPYYNLTLPDHSIIYCDPPYADKLGYGTEFDHNLFWDWCRYLHKQGHKLFISEYQAPSDFKCIWQQELACWVNKDQKSKYKTNVEKLFIHNG